MRRSSARFSRARSPSERTLPRLTSTVSKAGWSLFDDFLPYLIARLAHSLNADLIEKLRVERINLTRWRVLAVLAMREGITITELVERAMMQQSALSRALTSMAREGYVRRVVHRDDARCVEVYLTDKGRALFDTLNVVVRRREKRLLAGFSPAEVRAAFVLMHRLIRNMRG
jgi:MarR family transcriptional regulator, organic hydroperoxide resistance regulator